MTKRLLTVLATLATLLFPLRSIAGETNCESTLGKIQYSAEFQSKRATDAPAGNRRLLIGVPKQKSPHQLVAQIWSGNKCLATCEAKRFSDDSVDMHCQSAEMAAFSTRADVILSQSTLRFGTWLQGYETVSLKVTVDRFSRKLLAGR